MITNTLYGPQFDPSDGTIGRIQLVRRWTLSINGDIWTPARGPFTYDTEERANEHLKLIRASRDEDALLNLAAYPYWCWPHNFDPLYRAPSVLDTTP